jgi:hypothetical protein
MTASNSHSTHSPHTRRMLDIHKAYVLPIIIGNSTYGLGLTQGKRRVLGVHPGRDRGSNRLPGAFPGACTRYNDHR